MRFSSAKLTALRPQKEKYLSVEEMLRITKVSKSVIETLRAVGALKDLPESSQMSLF